MTNVKTQELSIRTARRLSREVSIGDGNSVEVYYRDGSVGVPFDWESQPGTPKLISRSRQAQLLLPPLTPPPSYLSSISRKPAGKQISSKLNSEKNLSTSSSSLWSVPSSPFRASNVSREGTYSSPRMSFDSRFAHSRMDEDENFDKSSPVSTLCFRLGRGNNGRSQGCSSSIIKLLLREFA